MYSNLNKTMNTDHDIIMLKQAIQQRLLFWFLWIVYDNEQAKYTDNVMSILPLYVREKSRKGIVLLQTNVSVMGAVDDENNI